MLRGCARRSTSCRSGETPGSSHPCHAVLPPSISCSSLSLFSLFYLVPSTVNHGIFTVGNWALLSTIICLWLVGNEVTRLRGSAIGPIPFPPHFHPWTCCSLPPLSVVRTFAFVDPFKKVDDVLGQGGEDEVGMFFLILGGKRMHVLLFREKNQAGGWMYCGRGNGKALPA